MLICASRRSASRASSQSGRGRPVRQQAVLRQRDPGPKILRVAGQPLPQQRGGFVIFFLPPQVRALGDERLSFFCGNGISPPRVKNRVCVAQHAAGNALPEKKQRGGSARHR